MINLKNKIFILNSLQKKRLFKNFFSVYSTESLQIISQIIFAPLMLFFWGVENFGIWLFLLSIPNIFLIFNINTQFASAQEITILNSKKKYSQSNKIFQNSIIFNLVNVLIITFLFIFAYLFNFIELSMFKKFDDNELKIIFLLIGISIYLNLFQSIFQTAINSIGKLYITFNISAYTDLISKLLIAGSGFYFNSLIYPSLIYFIFSLIRIILFYYYFSLNNKHLALSIKFRSWNLFLKIGKLSIGYTADIVNFLIKHSLVIFIIGIFLEPYIIGYIVTVKTLFYFFPARFIDKIRDISLFEFASLYGKGKYSIIMQNIKSLVVLIFIVSIFIIFASLTIGPFIYNLWTNYKYDLNLFFLSIILFDAFFFVLRNSIIAIFMAINRYIFLGISDLLITCIVTFLFYLSLYNQYSYIEGFFIILVGSFVSLVLSIFYFWYWFKKLKLKKK